MAQRHSTDTCREEWLQNIACALEESIEKALTQTYTRDWKTRLQNRLFERVGASITDSSEWEQDAPKYIMRYLARHTSVVRCELWLHPRSVPIFQTSIIDEVIERYAGLDETLMARFTTFKDGFTQYEYPGIIVHGSNYCAIAALWWFILANRLVPSRALVPCTDATPFLQLLKESRSSDPDSWYSDWDRPRHIRLWANPNEECDPRVWTASGWGPFVGRDVFVTDYEDVLPAMSELFDSVIPTAKG